MGETTGGVKGEEGEPEEEPPHLNALQSTGFDKNDLHCPLGRCAGRPGKQFLRSLKSRTLKQAGGSPVKKLFENVKF